jgi:hypothetical protein
LSENYSINADRCGAEILPSAFKGFNVAMLLYDEINSFRKWRRKRETRAMANAALVKFAGVELEEAMRFAASRASALRLRIKRLIERERLKGLKGDPSYELNSHICLKHALELLWRGERGRSPTTHDNCAKNGPPESDTDADHRFGPRETKRRRIHAPPFP